MKKIKIMARINGQNGWEPKAWFPLTVVEAEDELTGEELVGKKLATDLAEMYPADETGYDPERYGAYINRDGKILYHIELSGSVMKGE